MGWASQCVNNCIKGQRGTVGWASLTRNVEVGDRVPSKAPIVSLSKKLNPYCLELVGSRHRFKRDFTIQLKYITLECKLAASLNID